MLKQKQQIYSHIRKTPDRTTESFRTIDSVQTSDSANDLHMVALTLLFDC